MKKENKGLVVEYSHFCNVAESREFLAGQIDIPDNQLARWRIDHIL